MNKAVFALLSIATLVVLNLQAHANEINSMQAFEKEIKSDGVSVVKFSAVWCSPCRQYKPFFMAVAEQHTNVTVNGNPVSVNYLMVDVDKSPDIAEKYNIISIPATLFFKNGNKVALVTGFKDKDTLLKKIKEVAQLPCE